MKRVVITGASVVSPIGSSPDKFFAALESGQKGINRIQGFDTEYFPSDFGAEVKTGEQNNSGVDRKEKFISQCLEQLATDCPGIHRYQPEQRFMNLGAGIDYFDLPGYVSSASESSPQWLQYSMNTHLMTERLAAAHDIKGGFTVNVSACVASSQAIGFSYRMLSNTSKKMAVITGGCDSMLNHLHYMGFYKLGALSCWEGEADSSCRPFDRDRCGLVLGEGAAAFLLQDESDADRQKVLAEIVGYASTMDAYMITDPDPTGRALASAAVNAIKEAGLTPDEIDCVHLHGTGTIKNELAEASAMKSIFGSRYQSVPVFSLKGQVGHLIAACGAVEMLGVIYSLLHQVVPPTINFEEPDPDVPLMVVNKGPLEMRIKNVLKLNAAFGGQNTALVVKRYEP